MAEPANIAVIIVNYRTPDLALACLASLARARDLRPSLHVMLVDGGSGDGSAETLRHGIAAGGMAEWVELIALPVNGGFGYANNQALLILAQQPHRPDYVCLLNPDARIRSDAIERLAEVLDCQREAGAVGALLHDLEGRPQGSAFGFPSLRAELSRGSQTDIIRRLVRTPPMIHAPACASPVPWVTGAAAMLRWAALAEVGLFDDGFFLYFEEVELMHRLHRAGWQVWHQPAAWVEHIGGSATDVRWDETGFHKPMPLPTYWYRSRRRCLVRTGGTGFALTATLLFLLGRLLWLARTRLGGRRDNFPSRTSRDTIRYSLWPSRADRGHASLPRLGDEPGQRPLWQTQGQ